MKAARRKQPQCEFCGERSAHPCATSERASMCFLKTQTEMPPEQPETVAVSVAVSKGATP